MQQIRRKVTEEWRKMKLDAVICPAGAFPAPPFGSANLLAGKLQKLIITKVTSSLTKG